MMMALGPFLFEIGTAPYSELQRSTEWTYAQAERFGARKASQFTGPGDDKITLTGAIYPGQTPAKTSSLDTLRAMADAGEAYLLMDGQGNVMGHWLIRSLSDNRSVFFVDGVARKADFSLALERTDDPPTVVNAGASVPPRSLEAQPDV